MVCWYPMGARTMHRAKVTISDRIALPVHQRAAIPVVAARPSRARTRRPLGESDLQPLIEVIPAH